MHETKPNAFRWALTYRNRRTWARRCALENGLVKTMQLPKPRRASPEMRVAADRRELAREAADLSLRLLKLARELGTEEPRCGGVKGV